MAVTRNQNPEVFHHALNTIHDATDILKAWNIESKANRLSNLDNDEVEEYVTIFSKAKDNADMLQGSYIVVDSETIQAISKALDEAQRIIDMRS